MKKRVRRAAERWRAETKSNVFPRLGFRALAFAMSFPRLDELDVKSKLNEERKQIRPNPHKSNPQTINPTWVQSAHESLHR